MTCPHFWRDARGLCTACGEQPGLPHQHRFLYAQAGDTMLNCVDCHQIVYITPEKAGLLANEPVPPPEPLSLPELLLAATGGDMPHYVSLVHKYNFWMVGAS